MSKMPVFFFFFLMLGNDLKLLQMYTLLLSLKDVP